jgi:hypothetical protein
METAGVHELVGNALIMDGEKPRETDLRGEPLLTEALTNGQDGVSANV